MAAYRIPILAILCILPKKVILQTAQCDPPCENSGFCISLGGMPSCVCEAPYGPPSCSDICTECLDSRCPANINSGHCNVACTNNRQCPDDKICCSDNNCGTICFSACDSRPCLNGGLCLTRAVDAFECECTPQFTGPTCEIPVVTVNPCDSSPCQNNGICQRQGQGFRCQCRSGFKGRLCETRISRRCPPRMVKNCPRSLCALSPCSRFQHLTCKISSCGHCRIAFFDRYGVKHCDHYLRG